MNKRNSVLLTDLHMKASNIEHIMSIGRYASQFGVPIFVMGDLFDSRKAQSQKILLAMQEFLMELTTSGETVYVIPGNHDKTDYGSAESFLDIYKVEGVDVVRDSSIVEIGSIEYYLLPYFSEKGELYRENLSHLSKHAISSQNQKVLLTHIAVNGVRNNDKSEVKDGIPPNLFNVFDKVKVGHYHDEQEFGNIHYIGSTMQHDFSEDHEKFISIMHDDMSIEKLPIPMDIPKFITTLFNIDEVPVSALSDAVLVIQESDEKNYHRFRIFGSESNFNKINRGELEGAGIKLDYIRPSVQTAFTRENLDFAGYKKSDLPDAFLDFAEENTKEITDEVFEELCNEVDKL